VLDYRSVYMSVYVYERESVCVCVCVRENICNVIHLCLSLLIKFLKKAGKSIVMKLSE